MKLTFLHNMQRYGVSHMYASALAALYNQTALPSFAEVLLLKGLEYSIFVDQFEFMDNFSRKKM